jgi:hypothetical protein
MDKIMENCPKCNYKIGAGLDECPACGIVISKYLERLPGASEGSKPPPLPNEFAKEDWGETGKDKDYNVFGLPVWKLYITRLLYPNEKNCKPLITAGQALLLLVLLILSLSLWSSPIESNKAGESFLHLINLPFHEAGHIFFRPFGRFITSLGGTLGQFMIPLICLAAFLFYRSDNTAAAVCLWWTGENFLDIAPYVNDARSLTLPLIGGNTGQTAPYGFHDWEYLLTESGFLGYDHDIARACYFIGTMIMAVALLWAGILVWRQFQMLRNQKAA